MLAVAKMVNRQRPDVAIYAQFAFRDGLPAQAWHASDVRWTNKMPPAPYIDARDLIYRGWPPELYLESTVANWGDLTGLPITYERGVFPSFARQAWAPGGNYVLMVGHSKTTERGGREWGHENWAELARGFERAGLPVFQIGKATDRPLRAARSKFLGRRFPDVARLMAGARFYVGPENGVAVLAGYLGTPHAIVYDGYQTEGEKLRQNRLDFARQLKIVPRLEPPAVLEQITAWATLGQETWPKEPLR